MFKRFALLAVIAALVIGLVPSVGAQDDVWCGTDEEVEITFIAGTVGGEHEVYVALAERFMAALEQRINAFFTQALQMDSFTLELEASPDKA